jgi:hypothetical protein
VAGGIAGALPMKSAQVFAVSPGIVAVADQPDAVATPMVIVTPDEGLYGSAGLGKPPP